MLLPEIHTRLTDQSLVTTGFTVSRGKMLDSPDKVIALYEASGVAPDRFLGSTATLDNASLQVVVRGEPRDYETPRLQIERIYQAMCDWGAFTASGVRYTGIMPLQSPFFFQRDQNERILFAVNFLVSKAFSSTA